jgi:two-component system, NtrC family, response regulator AtoC
MGDYDQDDATGQVACARDDSGELCALVSCDGIVTSHVLPAHGLITIGRGASCDLQIDHPSISRHHATLQLSPLQISDTRSRNGTRIRGTTLAPGIVSRVEIGEAVQLGQAMLLIHYRQLVPDPGEAQIDRSPEALLRQLEIECARSARSGSPFAYVRMHVRRGVVAYDELVDTMRMTDVVAEDDAERYQLLLPETSAEQAAGAVARIRRLLARLNADARIAYARYPYDGTTPEALIARVWEQLDAPESAPPTEMDGVRALIAQVAVSDVSVFINGETGVGKELCAEMLHRQSRRAGRPFVKLNCSTITESLIESELFGHERGAFTGATAATRGLFEAGDGGTVFLDEIGELPMSAQAKLLRVFEDGVVRRVGSTVGCTLDVRFMCATNRVLHEEIDVGRFRRDLYYRLTGVTITIPPLRERVGEIAGLARAFAARPRGIASPTTLGDDVIAVLRRHPWPGNIRELRNTIERAVLLAGGRPVGPQHLGLEQYKRERSSGPTIPIERSSSPSIPMERSSSPTLPIERPTLPIIAGPEISGNDNQRLGDAIADVERKRILDALDRCGGNQTRAARMLGISRNTLLARLDSYGLPRPRKTSSE